MIHASERVTLLDIASDLKASTPQRGKKQITAWGCYINPQDAVEFRPGSAREVVIFAFCDA